MFGLHFRLLSIWYNRMWSIDSATKDDLMRTHVKYEFHYVFDGGVKQKNSRCVHVKSVAFFIGSHHAPPRNKCNNARQQYLEQSFAKIKPEFFIKLQLNLRIRYSNTDLHTINLFDQDRQTVYLRQIFFIFFLIWPKYKACWAGHWFEQVVYLYFFRLCYQRRS